MDREKVIKALAMCEGFPHLCGLRKECPYSDNGEECEENMHKDALAMLKELQPRVLSYDEIKTMLGKPVYVEEPKRNADPHCRWGLVIEGEEPPEEGGYNYPGGVDFNVEVGLDVYDGDLYMVDIGCGWRAWTAEPTDEQRMNTPWGGR